MLRVWSPLGVKSDTARDELRRANPTEGDGGLYKGARRLYNTLRLKWLNNNGTLLKVGLISLCQGKKKRIQGQGHPFYLWIQSWPQLISHDPIHQSWPHPSVQTPFISHNIIAPYIINSVTSLCPCQPLWRWHSWGEGKARSEKHNNL